jgi:hypothetical protein
MCLKKEGKVVKNLLNDDHFMVSSWATVIPHLPIECGTYKNTVLNCVPTILLFCMKATIPSRVKQYPFSFAPTYGGVLTLPEWKKYHFDAEDIEEVLSQAPDLVVARPDPPEEPVPERKRDEIFIPVMIPDIPAIIPALPAILPAPVAESAIPRQVSTRVHDSGKKNSMNTKLLWRIT